MKRRGFYIVSCISLLTCLSPASAGLVIGTSSIGNAFPFGGASTGHAGTRYQQVYAASNFSGPIALNTVRFFEYSGMTAPGTFSLYLSTALNPVNALNTSDFDSNVGADSQFLASMAIAGGDPMVYGNSVEFSGPSFIYDPADGDLLVDIFSSTTPSYTGFYQAMWNDAGGLFSRAHDFGTIFENSGLVTEFEGSLVSAPAPVPVPGAFLLGILGLGIVRGKLRELQNA